MPRESKSSSVSAPTISRAVHRSATPPPIRFCNSLRMKRSLGASGFMISAALRGASAILSISAASSRALLKATRATAASRKNVSIGKIGDIFAHRFTGEEIKRAGNMAHFDATLEALQDLPDGGMIFTNFLDFDTDFGHRRDVPGYAHCLEQFDARLPELFALMRPGDVVIITADHGNDPTWRGTDHTREHVPILVFGPGVEGGPICRRETLARLCE